MLDLVRGTVERVVEIDERITRHAEHWRMERMPVDRNITGLLGLRNGIRRDAAPITIDEASSWRGNIPPGIRAV